MAREAKYRCKGCNNQIIISESVLKLMHEKGQSIPERCDECKESKQKSRKQNRIPYRDIFIKKNKTKFFGISKKNITNHGDRNRQIKDSRPDTKGMKIKITDEHILQLYKKLQDNQVVILASPTGTGKSVQVLYRLLESPQNYEGDFIENLIRQGQVVQTQPVSAATQRIPQTIATKQLGETGANSLGTIGFRHRGNESYSKHNLGVVVTDGSLKNWIRDGQLGKYSLIMIDEAHIRSLNIDSLLRLLKHYLSLNPGLKAIIASATINMDEFKDSFAKEMISTTVFDLSETLVEKTNYHVHFWKEEKVIDCDCWMCRKPDSAKSFWKRQGNPPENRQLSEVVSDFVVETLNQTDSGGILVFLPGEAVIEKTKKIIEEQLDRLHLKDKIPVIPVYSRLGEKEVSKRFVQGDNDRRVLLTTDITETSHTLPDLVYIIESGYIKQIQWDAQSMSSTLPIIRHSKAGCRQRWGRVGRTKKGYVYTLYGKDQFENDFLIQTTPEIFRSQIDDVTLTVRAAGILKDRDFIGAPLNQNDFNAEIDRSQKAIKDSGYMDNQGNITEHGLEIFHIPLPVHEKIILDLADQRNCLLEVLFVMVMMKTDTGERRTGEDIYQSFNGLLVWDSRWTAWTKMRVWKIHQALKVGCRDDLEFVLKLATCYDKAQKQKTARQWADQHFVNYQVLEDIFAKIENLIQIYMPKAEERELRDVDFDLIEQIKKVFIDIGSGQEIEIKTDNESLLYFVKTAPEVKGIVSDGCAGEWKNGDKALLLMASKKTVFADGKIKTVPVSSFMIKLEKVNERIDKSYLFIDQFMPIGKQIVLSKKDDKYSIITQKSPADIRIKHKKVFSFEEDVEDSLKDDSDPIVQYLENAVPDQIKKMQIKSQFIWAGDKRAEKAEVVGWSKEKEIFNFLITAKDETDLLQEIKSQKKIMVKVEKIHRDIGDKRGWVQARTLDGIEIPIEIPDMSLSSLGYGLEKIEGEPLYLDVVQMPNSDKELEGLRLSNLDNIISDLSQTKSSLSDDYYLEGFVEDINPDKEELLVCAKGEYESGVVNFFSVKKNKELIVDNFNIGDSVKIKLSLRDGLCQVKIMLNDDEIDFIKRSTDWQYNEQTGYLSFSYGLDMASCAIVKIKEETKEICFRNSWRYMFFPKIVPSDDLLEIGDIVEGEVVKRSYGKNNPDIIVGVVVKIKTGSFELKGYVPYRFFLPSEDEDFEKEIPEVGDVLNLEVEEYEYSSKILILSISD